MKIFALFLLAILSPALLIAEAAYVSDEFEITMRSGPSTQNSILRMLPSGATVEVLETDEETGYSRISTASGAEGYALSRFLMDQPAARDQLAGMRQQVSNLRQRNQELEARLGQATASRDELRQERDGLLRSNQGKDTELADIRRVSANAIDLNSQNQELQTSVQTMNESSYSGSDFGDSGAKGQKKQGLVSRRRGRSDRWNIAGLDPAKTSRAKALELERFVVQRGLAGQTSASDIFSSKKHPGLHHCVRVERHGLDTLLH